MTTPTGTPVASFTPPKIKARRMFTIWAVLTVLAAILMIVMASALNAKLNAFMILLVVFAPGAMMLLSAIEAFAPVKKLDIYTDGFIITNSRDLSTKESGLWSEVRDITWPADRRKSSMLAAGGILFGVIGAAVAAALAYSSVPREGYLYIEMRHKKVAIDASDDDSGRVHAALLTAIRDYWLAETTKAIERGSSVEFGTIWVTPTEVLQKDAVASWESVVEAKYMDQEGLVGVVWNSPDKKTQTMSVRLGFRGDVLIQFVNQKIGKSSGIFNKLGKL